MTISYLNSKDLKNIFINENQTISKVIENIDRAAIQIALVLDDRGGLAGLVTDGDIRRGLLRGVSMQDQCKLVINQKYKSVPGGFRLDEAKIYMNSLGLSHLPVLDVQNHVLGMFVADRLVSRKSREGHVVIMAGGKGSRLFPLTKKTPKPLIKFGDKTLIEHVIDQCKFSGFTNFVIAVNHLKSQIIDFLGDGTQHGVTITYIQEDIPLGTAGALSLIPRSLNLSDDFLVLNADVIHDLDLSTFLDFHIEGKYDATIGVKYHQISVPYGVVKTKEQMVSAIEEKPIFNYLINAGIYSFNRKILDLMPYNEFFNVTDLITDAVRSNLRIGAYQIYENWIDVGTKENLLRSNDK